MKCSECGHKMLPPFLAITKANVEMLGLNFNTTRIYAGLGLIPTRRIGRRRYIDTAKLLDSKTIVRGRPKLKAVGGER